MAAQVTTSAAFMFASRNVHTMQIGGVWGYRREGHDGDSGVFHTMPNRERAILVARKVARREGVEHVVHGPDGRVVSREQFS